MAEVIPFPCGNSEQRKMLAEQNIRRKAHHIVSGMQSTASARQLGKSATLSAMKEKIMVEIAKREASELDW